jgi:hypothetical protein
VPVRFGRWFVAVVTVVAVVAATHATVAPAAPALECNGRARLCGLTLGQVAFATTHNSMSSPADGFFGPNQGRTIEQQLRHGIHGFQIDAFLGYPRQGRVYTELAGPFGSQATDLPPALVATATRIHQALGAPPPGTPTTAYLCHSFCELGAVEMVPTLVQMRRFLDAHRHDVLVMVIEDYVPPEGIRAAFASAGLEHELVSVQAGAPLPTLGAMVRADTRLLVSLENGDGGPTLPNAFTGLVQETPFTFLKASDLTRASSCVPNRGVAGSPIFQLNHWVTPPTRRRARLVNSRALRTRAQRCAKARGHIPTLVAVDFAESSDVLSVVDELNRGTPSR